MRIYSCTSVLKEKIPLPKSTKHKQNYMNFYSISPLRKRQKPTKNPNKKISKQVLKIKKDLAVI